MGKGTLAKEKFQHHGERQDRDVDGRGDFAHPNFLAHGKGAAVKQMAIKFVFILCVNYVFPRPARFP